MSPGHAGRDPTGEYCVVDHTGEFCVVDHTDEYCDVDRTGEYCVVDRTGEYCVVERYEGSYAAFSSYDTCYVAYGDDRVLWFDAVNRSCYCTICFVLITVFTSNRCKANELH